MKIKFLFLIVLISTIARSQISTTSALAPTITNAGLGDLYLTSDTKQLYIGLSNGTLSLIGNEGDWSLNGNSNASATSFLGTTTDTKLSLASNNTSIFELGKRGTLGVTNFDIDQNQYMAYLRGGNGVSALQFEIPVTNGHNSVLSTTKDGNFRLKGSAAGANDFFQIGGTGTSDDGSLEIVTGDNGDEPIVFKKNHYIDGTSEMMRIQGQGSGATSTTRVGIMTNGAVANSVLQVGGSVSLPIRTVTAGTTLTENDYTLIVKPGTYTGTAITFPAANTCKGRIYVIRNTSGSNLKATPFLDITGASYDVVFYNAATTFQSDGSNWYQIGNENGWGLNGNSNATATSLLGTTTDTKVALASNNTSILELGKRGTLGLVDSARPEASNADQYMAYLKGNGVSALQFESSAAPSWKPVLYTTTDGNFRIKGAAAAGVGYSDYFEMGSAGTANNGSLEFITGDDGNEPIVFKKMHFTDGIKEMMRIEGYGVGANSTSRVGIMTNGVTANSVLQVGGSLSLPIRAVTASTTLTENDYTLILKSGTYTGTGVTLPYANTCKGRIYILKNISGANISISTFYNRTGAGSAVLINGRIYSIQSDGTDFHQISDDY
ncbi:hypothetical protein [Flavobacterium sp. T12S277]|uniref:hypothetical protein n=1 Tax=Flavobacterium sp. T12S277 TaxID=3402752 RepID=UPI003AEBA54A